MRIGHGFDVHRFEAFLAAVACPVLMVWGEYTPFKPPDTDRRVGLLKDVASASVQGAGHNLHHEAPEALTEVMVSFLRKESERSP